MNLITMIAKELGVEVGEEFKVTKYNNVVFRFDETSLQFFNSLTNDWKEVSDEFYRIMMKGNTEVEKLPFEPKDGDLYWGVGWVGLNENVFVGTCVWHDTKENYADKYCGNCFRTEAEAEKHKFEIYEKLTGRKWEET